MEKEVMSSLKMAGNILCSASSFIRKCIFGVLRVGPILNHIALIMDGNRRYAKKQKLSHDGAAGGGVRYDAGFWALMVMLLNCQELGVKYITAYAFSIDNFKRKPEEVESLMTSMLEKFHLLDILVKLLAVRVHFAGNLELLSNELRASAMELTEATAAYSKSVLTICIAYTSRDEILHAVRESCEQKRIDLEFRNDDDNEIKLMKVEKNMYMAVAPDPDIIIRTGGENRLSNFLLWQSCWSHLHSMWVLWPEIGVWNLVFAILNFQRNKTYCLEMKKKEKEL
ncbi:dehydrodolichyl diphosphate synthase CPT3-like [Gossypium arboreum]|uniref:dehydrodolichyl diphosphate synthase CPT3-like n=1 Tax=Gossypium arboreum TaxID=29729 RepID=UPI0022F1B7A2|nr:dehydrodolichyl diphosphate synthase CPT3-like [Gossypium arboreum]